MGVDCMMFAERAKKCVWLDRRHNVPAPVRESFSGDWWLGFMAALDMASRDGGLWQSNDGQVSECMWARDSAIANRKTAREFIQKHGADDRYLIITDHDEPSCHEYAAAHGYVQERG
jgi:hypothetical protein